MVLIFFSSVSVEIEHFIFDYDTRTLLEDTPPRRGLKNGAYSFIPEMYEIFHTFFDRHNVDIDILHEEADGQSLPAGELEYDWVGNLMDNLLV